MQVTAAPVLHALGFLFPHFSLPSSHGDLSGGTTLEVCVEPRSEDRGGVICERFSCSLHMRFAGAFCKSYSTGDCYQRCQQTL